MPSPETVVLGQEAIIAKLRAENAALKATNTYLKGVRDEKLLAAQHRIKELREVLESFAEIRLDTNDLPHGFAFNVLSARTELATPDNTTELDALVRDAEQSRKMAHTFKLCYEQLRTLLSPVTHKAELEDCERRIDAAMKADHDAK